MILWDSLPYIFAGLRLGFGFAVKGMVVAELWVTTGTGKLLIDLGGNRQLDKYFAIALLIVAVGAIGTWLIRMLQRFAPRGPSRAATRPRGAVREHRPHRDPEAAVPRATRRRLLGDQDHVARRVPAVSNWYGNQPTQYAWPHPAMSSPTSSRTSVTAYCPMLSSAPSPSC